MKNIYILFVFLSYSSMSFGQDTLKTEIVFKTNGTVPMKVYKLEKQTYIYYGSNSSSFDYDGYEHSHYPYKGTSYEREYLLTAPGSVFVPNNKEISYVVVDNKDWLSTRFTTTTDGKRQVWNLVPTGKNYKPGRNTMIAGVIGLLASGALFAVAVSQDFKYNHNIERYKMDLDFYSETGYTPANFRTHLLSSASGASLPSNPPGKPSDNRMGYGIPIAATTVSLTAIITGINIMFKNSPRVERLE